MFREKVIWLWFFLKYSFLVPYFYLWYRLTKIYTVKAKFDDVLLKFKISRVYLFGRVK